MNRRNKSRRKRINAETDVPEDLPPSDWEAIIDWIVEEPEQEKPKGKK